MLSTLLFGATEITLVSVFGTIFVALIIYLCFVPMKSWFIALFAGAYIPTFMLIDIKNNKLNVKSVVSAYILAKKAKLNIKLSQIENIMLAGGNIIEIINAIKLAQNAKLKLDLDLACAIDSTSKEVLSIVNQSINSRQLTIDEIKGFTQDGIEIIVSVNVAVKIDLLRYVDGLGEEELKSTIRAWIMENICKSKDYKLILKEPNISLLSNLDLRVVTKNSMFRVLDINIGEVRLGRNLNTEREIQAAEKEKIYAQIEAERMKNAEEIKELQMRTKTEQMKSNVLQAEAEVPKAISQAIKEGRFSVMDYYKLMNLQADTALRKAIIDENKTSPYDDDDDEDF